MNIGLICKRHYTNKDLIQSAFGRLFYFPKFWHEQGHQLSITLADYYSLRRQQAEHDSIAYNSIPVFPLPQLFYKQALTQHRTNRIDIIVASGDALMGHYGNQIAKALGIPFVFDLYHDYSEFRIASFPALKEKYYNALREAKLVVCDSQPLAERVIQYQENTKVFPQGTDTTVFFERTKRDTRAQLGIGDDVSYFGYTGSLDRRFHIDLVMQTLRILNERGGKGFKLLIAGKNVSKFNLAHPNVIYLGELAQEQIPTVISACDVMIMPLINEGLAQTCNPCKLSEYIACNRPMVTTNFSNISDYLSKQHSIVEVDTAENFAEKIRTQSKTPKLYELKPSMLWSNIGAQYLDALQECVNVQ